MEAQDLLKEIKVEHANCRKAEERLRKTWRGVVVVALLAISLIALVNVGILWQATSQNGCSYDDTEHTDLGTPYTDAVAARAYLVGATALWTIDGDSLAT